MKNEMKDTYSVAWFRLAECISRREKERALGVYRLLSHSFENRAIKYQLEGDILLAFDDRLQAVDRYEKAAQAYLEQQEFSQAAAVYDHLFFISGKQSYVETVIALYAERKDAARVVRYLHHACQIMLQRNDVSAVAQVCDRFSADEHEHRAFITELTYRVLEDALIAEDMKSTMLKRTLKELGADVQALGIFLANIKAKGLHFYQQACVYLEQTFGH
jgi:hypothetical protein